MLQSTRRRKLKWLAVLQPAAKQGKDQVIPTGDAAVDSDVVVDALMQLLHNPQVKQ